MRSYSVRENSIGSAVTEIIRYKQTDRQENTHPVTLLEGLKIAVYCKNSDYISYIICVCVIRANYGLI